MRALFNWCEVDLTIESAGVKPEICHILHPHILTHENFALKTRQNICKYLGCQGKWCEIIPPTMEITF